MSYSLMHFDTAISLVIFAFHSNISYNSTVVYTVLCGL